MLGHMSSRVVLSLLDCLQSSHDAAVQFDSRPGLKFLVQKVSRFDVAANLYRQAGIARTVYTHVLLELCSRLEDLSVHKMRQLLADNGGTSADEKCLTNDAARRRYSSSDNMVCCHLLNIFHYHGHDRALSGVYVSVCLSLFAIKGKWLELSTPKSVEI